MTPIEELDPDHTPLERLDTADPSDGTAKDKEVNIRFSRDQNRATVYAEIGSVVGRLVAHPQFQPLAVRLEGDTLTGVRGRIPIRYVTVGTGSRNHDRPSGIVSAEVYN